MFRFAWAYQGSDQAGEGFPYPVQSISIRLLGERPATKLARPGCHIAIRSRAPSTRTEPGALYIFSRK